MFFNVNEVDWVSLGGERGWRVLCAQRLLLPVPASSGTHG